MKKLYEEPIFEINKFSFEEILNNDNARVSDAESDVNSDGDNGEEPTF